MQSTRPWQLNEGVLISFINLVKYSHKHLTRVGMGVTVRLSTKKVILSQSP